MLTKKNAENAVFFSCEKCLFTSCRRSNYEKHLLTRKHNLFTFVDKKEQKNAVSICVCGREYKTRQGLYAHKKKCLNNNEVQPTIINTIIDNQNIENVKINSEDIYLNVINQLKNIVLEQSRQITELLPRIGNTTNNNQRFNINVFLNEQCRDAIDINEFVKSIQISVAQLDTINSKGMVEGLSHAIMENMKHLSLYERPIHCTDIKRETLYIKDHNEWACDKDKTKIKKAIKSIAGKQYQPLKEWIEQNPDFKENDSKQEYVANVLSTIGKNTESENIDSKIIKNLCTHTYVKQ